MDIAFTVIVDGLYAALKSNGQQASIRALGAVPTREQTKRQPYRRLYCN